ncbi:hypothetical protein [Pseudomonas sp. TE50-2]|uniref:hypothetical protein n=1 Tax=Pseudomonas sp. TE50-2 TaxID=3142707 RepID=UPI00346538ED
MTVVQALSYKDLAWPSDILSIPWTRLASCLLAFRTGQGSGNTEDIIVSNRSKAGLARRAATRKKQLLLKGGRMEALRITADDLLEDLATKPLSGGTWVNVKIHGRNHPARAPHLSDVERDLSEQKKLVAALAIRSVAHGEVTSVDTTSMTVLDAETAEQMLDSPPEPTKALCNLFVLR